MNALPGAPRMTPRERRVSAGLAALFALRMLGMFIILPVFALYAEHLPGGGDRALVGLALGAYGLTQAILQVPFGWASDRYGRKPVLYAGLAVFAAGSFVAAAATHIGWVIAGRTLQGAGAVSAVIIALAADLTRAEVRSKAMALIGISIGATFGVSLVVGPPLASWIGVPGIFALTGVLVLLAMGVVRAALPEPPRTVPRAGERAGFLAALADANLMRLNFGIFALHASLMALFVEVPLSLRHAGLAPERQWMAYLAVFVASAAVMLPAMRHADRRDRAKAMFVGAIAVLLLAQVVLALGHASLAALVVGLLAFFCAFNVLEASLPSLVSKFAPPSGRGGAIGVYSSVQFLGTFAGAAAGGWLAQRYGGMAAYALGIVLVASWLFVSLSMARPPAYNSPALSEEHTHGVGQ